MFVQNIYTDFMLFKTGWYQINKIVKTYRSFLLLTLFQIITNQILAQKEVEHTFGNKFQFDVLMTDKRTMTREPVYVPVSDKAIYQIFNKLQTNNKAIFTPKSPVLLGVKLNPLLTQYYANSVQSVSKDYQTFVIADSSEAFLIAMGINPDNISAYKYHVVENDSSEIVPWSPIPALEQKYGATQPYGFIGKFKAPGHWLMVEVVNIKNYAIREGVIFDWRVSFKPILSEIRIGTPSGYFNIGYTKINRGYATAFNRLGVPSDLHFHRDSVLWISVQLKRQETLVHSAYLIKTLNGRKDTSERLGFVDRYGFFQLNKSSFTAPGHYELIIKKQERQVAWNEADMLRIPFDVLPPLNEAGRFTLKQLLLFSIAIAALFILYVIYQKQKLKKTQQRETTMQLKLKSLRSQLNPHFMFNALSSIQNLVNKNELLEANLYLAKFAGLTRKVLNSTQQEMISLEEELKITDDYLQMEQLRFGFEYRIAADPLLIRSNIDIPAMLLQPFIENAVKHGIAMLKRSGIVLVSIAADGHNLLLSVEDNGQGFDTEKIRSGNSFGLKLSEERISLLNQLYKHQPAKLTVASRSGQTIVRIILTNWI